MVPAAGAGGTTPLRPELPVAEQSIQERPEASVVHLARKVLEESLELIEIPVRGRQEPRRIDLLGRHARDVDYLEHQLIAEALHLPADPDQIASFEAPCQHVGISERAGRNRPAGVPKLERQI